MSAADSVDRLSRRMTGDQDLTSWAKTPPPGGAKNSPWERAIIDLAEAGEARFVRFLRAHVESGVIRSERAQAVLRIHA